MPEVGLDQLFHKSWFCGDYVALLLCVLYAPVGVAVAAVRVCVCVQAVIALYLLQTSDLLRALVLRVMAAVLGVWVTTERAHMSSSCHVTSDVTSGSQSPRTAASATSCLIANCVSWFDTIAVQMAAPCVCLCGYRLPSFLHTALRLRPVTTAESVASARDTTTSSSFSSSSSSSSSNLPLLLQPECAPTSGKVGLLSFNSKMLPAATATAAGGVAAGGAAAGGVTVQPVALAVHRPWPWRCLAVSTLDSSPVADLLYLFFVPVTVFSVRFLPVLCAETADLAMEGARVAIANSLSIQTTSYTVTDKLKLVKRRRLEALAPSSGHRAPPPSAHMTQMALQVQQVLPHVPLAVIHCDLAKTHCMDRTIANLLESTSAALTSNSATSATATATATATSSCSSGTVVNRSSRVQHHSAAAATATATAATATATAATTTTASHSKNHQQQRHLSFQERKQNFLQSARLRYIEKHGLQHLI